MTKCSNNVTNIIKQSTPNIAQQTSTYVLKKTHPHSSLMNWPLSIQALFTIARGSMKADTNPSKDNGNINNTTRIKCSTCEKVENTIHQDIKDNSANIMNENVDTKTKGWFQWLKDSVQLPTILKKEEYTMISNETAHEEREYFNKTNNITIDRSLESIIDNTNYTVVNASGRPLIGNSLNNSIQEQLSNIAGTITLFELVLKKFGLNISLGHYDNNYTSPEKEQEMQLDMLASEILPALRMWNNLLKNGSRNADIFEDDTLENGALDLLFTNSSRNQLQGDIQENAPE